MPSFIRRKCLREFHLLSLFHIDSENDVRITNNVECPSILFKYIGDVNACSTVCKVRSVTIVEVRL